MFRLVLAIATLATASMALADATIPTADKKGSKDNPLMKPPRSKLRGIKRKISS